jgi:peptidoglycan/LPS O-acetylase OafA/YrhL
MFSYLPHIDGLRAVAVWLVVLFHINADFFTRGYLGVDVFFVISGFVITQSLYKDYLTNGHVNIFQFYVRRFKRLYPALVTMLIGTSVAYFFFGFLWDTNLYLKSAISALFASSNLYFLYHGTNYFHQDLINPLVHTWSLGIEEQFYLLYPLLLSFGLFIVRKYKVHIKSLAGFILLLSLFSYALFAFNTENILGAFYFPFARFWELGIGCALSLFTMSITQTRFPSVFAFFGIATLFILQFFQKTISSVHVETMLAVIATSAIIYAGLRTQSVIERLLSKPSVVYMGKLSYSLYLWHLPVIYFANLYLTPGLLIVVAPAVSILLAMISYHYVETPLRYSESLNTVLVRMLKIVPIVIILCIACISYIGVSATRLAVNKVFNDFSSLVGTINYIEIKFDLGKRIQPNYFPSDDAMSACLSEAKTQSLDAVIGTQNKCLKLSDSSSHPLFYLVGDSHALHFIQTFYTSHVVQNLLFNQFSSNTIVASRAQGFDENEAQEALDNQVHELEALHTKFPDIYYVVSLFLTPKKDQVDTIESNLRRYIQSLSPYAKIIFIAPTPIFPSGPESCVLLEKYCTISRADDQKEQQAISDMLQRLDAESERVFVLNPYPTICPDSLCRNYIRETDTLVYLDDDHLTPEEGRLIAPVLDMWLQSTFVNLR